jgi:hypothetical protein
MAAKALCALIPLRAVPLKAGGLLEALNSSLAYKAIGEAELSSSRPSTLPSHNLLHGTLSLCYELLDSLRRRLAGVGDNKTFLLLLQVLYKHIFDRSPRHNSYKLQ